VNERIEDSKQILPSSTFTFVVTLQVNITQM